MVKSRFPYTTVTLFKEITPKTEDAPATYEVVRTATVGTFYRDEYTHEGGRLATLRLLSTSMNDQKDLKKAVWTAYMKRPRD